MQLTQHLEPHANYDPRWFIWTIVFLIVTGVSLATYITVAGTAVNADVGSLLVAPRHAKTK